jgi:hypothetical protein
MNNPTLTISESQLVSAFTEWERRYRQNPERFQSEATKLQKVQPETYAAACASYIFAMLERAQIAEHATQIAAKVEAPAPAADAASAAVL